jgi:hypothetical protein
MFWPDLGAVRGHMKQKLEKSFKWLTNLPFYIKFSENHDGHP